MKIRRATLGDATGIANVHVQTWRSTYKGIIPDEYLDSLTIENRTKSWQRHLRTLHIAIFVVENEAGEIIGFAAGGPEQTKNFNYQAELYTIYILDDYQQQNIGKQLFKTVVEFLEEKQYQNMLIWALEKNVNRRFYESLGGQLVASKSISIFGKELREVGYAWGNMNDLLTQLTQQTFNFSSK
jgi:L-amino acid N-acyltransferase YncA